MATIRKRGPWQWQAQVRKKGQPLQTKTFETRAEVESTTLKELLERYLDEVTHLKKGVASETNRQRALMRLPLARRCTQSLAAAYCTMYNWRWRPPCARGN